MSAHDPYDDPDSMSSADDPAVLLEQALERSRRHGRAALAEALACMQALLDAASLATSGVPAASHGILGRLATSLGNAAAGLTPSGDNEELLEAVASALDEEITRWEQRAQDDPDARAVLRAFLGVRELLWELGIRRERGPRPGGARAARPEPRVQRVRVQGSPGA